MMKLLAALLVLLAACGPAGAQLPPITFHDFVTGSPSSTLPLGSSLVPTVQGGVSKNVPVTSLNAGFQAVALAGSAFTPNLALGTNLQLTLVHGTCPCTLQNMTGLLPGQSGTIRVINSSSGSEQLTLSGSQYGLTTTPPFTSDPLSKSDWLYYVNADSQILIPQAILPLSISNTAPNQLLGGDGMTSNWTSVTDGATLATGQTCTDPIGGTNTCARLTEDGASSVHRTVQNTTLVAGPTTVSVFVKNGSGTRLVELRMADSLFNNAASQTFDPVACSDTVSGAGPGVVGTTAVVIGHGVISRPNGFCEGWMQANLNGPTPVFTTVQLSTPSGDNYPGNSTSNVLLWRPAARVGVLSPP
jgi:hypothetical protein